MGVEISSKALGKPKILVESQLSLVCLACPPLPSPFSFKQVALSSLSLSLEEFLEAAVSGAVGSGGGWSRSQGSQEVGYRVDLPFTGCGPEK